MYKENNNYTTKYFEVKLKMLIKLISLSHNLIKRPQFSGRNMFVAITVFTG